MAVIVGSAAGGAWNTNGAWVGGVQPTAADDVQLTAATGNVNIPAAQTVFCRSLDCTTYTGTLTFNNTCELDVGDASGGAFKLVAGMTLTLGSNTTLRLKGSAASTTYQITSAGKTLPAITIATGVSSTTYQLADAMIADAIIFTSGTFDTNGKTCTWLSFSSSNSNTRTLTLGASTITCTGLAAFWTVTSTGLTVTANTATVTCGQSGATFAGGGVNYNGMTLALTSAGAFITGANTFGALTRTGTAVITSSLSLSASQTITGALTLNGNSALNRLWVQSNTVGTARTLTCNGTVTAQYVDFEDITGAGSASWNLSAITGGSGDTGGNSGITFSTPVNRYAVVAGNWSNTATWSATTGGAGGASVPLPQDTAVFDSSSAAGTYTMDLQRFSTIMCTGFTRTLSLASSATERFIHGSLTLGSGMTFSVNGFLTFAGRGSHTLTMAGKAFPSVNRVINFGRFGGTYTLQDAAIFGAAGSNILALTFSAGTFDANNQNVDAEVVNTAAAATITMGTGTWRLLSTSSTTIWNPASGTTISGASATIVVASVSANLRTFMGVGKTYGTLTYTVAGSTGGLDITGANTFGTLNFSDVTNARTLRFTAGTTTTISTLWNVNGTSGKLMTVGSITAAGHTLSKASGTVSSDFLSISRSTSTGGAGWYAGANSTDGGNNSGWIFTAPPAFTGTADFSGTGTLSASGSPSPTGSVSFSGDGTLTASGSPAPTGSVSLSGTGTLSASGSPSPTGAATLSGDGTLGATGSPVSTSSVSLSGDGTLSGSGSPSPAGTAAFTGDGTLSVAGFPSPTVSASFTGTGVLVATGVARGPVRDITVSVGAPYAHTTADAAPPYATPITAVAGPTARELTVAAPRE